MQNCDIDLLVPGTRVMIGNEFVEECVGEYKILHEPYLGTELTVRRTEQHGRLYTVEFEENKEIVFYLSEISHIIDSMDIEESDCCIDSLF